MEFKMCEEIDLDEVHIPKTDLWIKANSILSRVVPLRQQPYKFCGLIYFWHQPVTRPGVRDR
jgi:hypothetical protein